ncbi:hypothetical protein EAF00_002294 [Botryotinia globosa]|nr:hypothetical protein EAF00_002294 [Botryotinia globosa]
MANQSRFSGGSLLSLWVACRASRSFFAQWWISGTRHVAKQSPMATEECSPVKRIIYTMVREREEHDDGFARDE